MATLYTRAVVGLGLARLGAARPKPWPYWGLATLLPLVPDLDAFSTAAYGPLLGHRGLTHSLAFALVVSVLAASATFRYFRANWWSLTGTFFAIIASHGLLDAMTRGGGTIPFFWPLDGREKGDRSILCEAPFGPFRQIGPVPFFPGNWADPRGGLGLRATRPAAPSSMAQRVALGLVADRRISLPGDGLPSLEALRAGQGFGCLKTVGWDKRTAVPPSARQQEQCDRWDRAALVPHYGPSPHTKTATPSREKQNVRFSFSPSPAAVVAARSRDQAVSLHDVVRIRSNDRFHIILGHIVAELDLARHAPKVVEILNVVPWDGDKDRRKAAVRQCLNDF